LESFKERNNEVATKVPCRGRRLFGKLSSFSFVYDTTERLQNYIFIVQMESMNLNNRHDFNFQYGKPTLWINGGHPLVPSSSMVFDKIQSIVAFSAAVWPKKNLLNIHLDGIFLACTLIAP